MNATAWRCEDGMRAGDKKSLARTACGNWNGRRKNGSMDEYWNEGRMIEFYDRMVLYLHRILVSQHVASKDQEVSKQGYNGNQTRNNRLSFSCTQNEGWLCRNSYVIRPKYYIKNQPYLSHERENLNHITTHTSRANHSSRCIKTIQTPQ